MNYEALNKIDEQLKSLDCKSYSLEIRFDKNTKVLIEKRPDDAKEVGFHG